MGGKCIRNFQQLHKWIQVSDSTSFVKIISESHRTKKIVLVLFFMIKTLKSHTTQTRDNKKGGIDLFVFFFERK